MTAIPLNLTTGDHDNTDSYITVMLSKGEIAKFFNDMFDEQINPEDESNTLWLYAARKVGSALWAMYAEQYPEPYTFTPEEEEDNENETP